MDEPAAVPGPSALDELLRGLAEEGELVDEGEITLDEAGARAKLQEYRLAEPEMWAVMAVRAAGWADATRVRYRNGNDPELEIEGLSLEASDLEALSVHALVDVHRFDGVERSRAAMRRALAIAVMGALETSATTVIVESHADELVRLTMSDKGESIETTPLDDPPRTPFVRLIVDRPGLFASRSSRELALLRSMARYARFEILLGGSPMPRMVQQRLPDHPFEGTVRFSRPPLEGFCTRDESLLPEHRGKILFVVGGVVLSTRPLGNDEHAVVVHGEFAGDLSDSEIREDGLFREAMIASEWALEATLKAKVQAFDAGGPEIRTPTQRRIAIAAVAVASIAILIPVVLAWTENAILPSQRLEACREDADRCLEAAAYHRKCADRHADHCDDIPMLQHRMWALEAYQLSCDAGVREGCRQFFDTRYDWLGSEALSDETGEQLRTRLCEQASAVDCRAIARDFVWDCARRERCSQVVTAAARACELEGESPCPDLEALIVRLPKMLDALDEGAGQERERLEAALKLARTLKGR